MWTAPPQDVGKRLADQVLHDEVRTAVVERTEREHLHEPVVTDHVRDAAFLHETLDPHGIAHRFGRKHLIATCASIAGSIARYTHPMPPRPSREATR
jgi:hypothetical protein